MSLVLSEKKMTWEFRKLIWNRNGTRTKTRQKTTSCTGQSWALTSGSSQWQSSGTSSLRHYRSQFHLYSATWLCLSRTRIQTRSLALFMYYYSVEFKVQLTSLLSKWYSTHAWQVARQQTPSLPWSTTSRSKCRQPQTNSLLLARLSTSYKLTLWRCSS